MKVGIALDNWKLPIFRKMLSDAGYTYEDGGALTYDSTLLTIVTDNMLRLKDVVAACQRECAKSKGKLT